MDARGGGEWRARGVCGRGRTPRPMSVAGEAMGSVTLAPALSLRPALGPTPPPLVPAPLSCPFLVAEVAEPVGLGPFTGESERSVSPCASFFLKLLYQLPASLHIAFFFPRALGHALPFHQVVGLAALLLRCPHPLHLPY